jgi:hypothetical protein
METRDTLSGYPSYEPLVEVREPAALAISWLDWLLSVKGRSNRTIDSYGVIVRQWFQWCDSHAVDPLSPELADLEGFVTRPTYPPGARGDGLARYPPD